LDDGDRLSHSQVSVDGWASNRRTEHDGPMSTTEGTEHPDEHHVTVFTAVGGQVFFDRLVERFYVRVAGDEVLLRLYPEQEDHGPARERLALFLGQFWGGPQVYT